MSPRNAETSAWKQRALSHHQARGHDIHASICICCGHAEPRRFLPRCSPTVCDACADPVVRARADLLTRHRFNPTTEDTRAPCAPCHQPTPSEPDPGNKPVPRLLSAESHRQLVELAAGKPLPERDSRALRRKIEPNSR